MEFFQFHPSGLIPSGILITEGAQSGGRVLLNKDGERFMERYAPGKLELASRDVVSRAMMTEIEEGRGFKDEKGQVRTSTSTSPEIGAEKMKERLGGIREIAMKFRAIDPVEEPASGEARLPLHDGRASTSTSTAPRRSRGSGQRARRRA